MTAPTPVWILGGYQTDFKRNWTKEGLDIGDLIKETVNGTLEAAGISANEVGAIHGGNALGALFTHQIHMGAIVPAVVPELSGRPSTMHEGACASGSVATMMAMAELEAGRQDVELVFGAEIQRCVAGQVGAGYMAAGAWVGHEGKGQDLIWPSMFSQVAQEYANRYGLNEEFLREIALSNFANAKRNPKAMTRDWPTPHAFFDRNNDEANPVIAGRIRRSDCSQVTDGGAGIILVSDRWMQENRNRLQGPVARIAGWGHTTASIHLQQKLDASADDKYMFPYLRKAITDAYDRARIESVWDLDGIETHDCFTPSQLVAIEHFGITEPGHGGEALGFTTLDGKLPINASGGLMGAGHPIGATGVRMILDASKQVTDQATGYQIEGARRIATLNFGGSAATVVCTIIESE